MTPDFDVRLTSVIKSLEEIIIPAIDPAQSLAREQAATALLHLKVIQGQSAYLADYQVLCLAEISRLGRALAAAAQGGRETLGAAAAVTAAVDSAMAQGQPLSTLAERRDLVAFAIDALIDASAQDGAPAFLIASQERILDHGQVQTARDRAWFKEAGLDPDAGTLPTPAELVETLTQSGPAGP